MGKRVDHTGKVYNSWTVLYYVGVAKTGNESLWRARCKCGFEKDQKICSLTNGTSRQCVTCAQKVKYYKGVVPEPMWNLIKRRSLRKYGVFDITREEAADLFLKQNRKCALSGLDIVFAEYGNDYLEGNQTASLDRIDSSKLYVIENVQWVHKKINLMKNILDEKEFISLCQAVAKTQGHYGKKRL